MSHVPVTRSALALSALLALAGCSSKPTFDLPQYEGSSQSSAYPNQETEAGTLYHLRRMTPDSQQKVAAWYRDELVAKRGWRDGRGLGPTFVDGNLTVKWTGSGPGEVSVIDQTRTGGHVVVYTVSNRTFIELWQFVPKP